MKICVLGQGYMGLPTACMFAVNGHEVVGVDINPEVVDKINKGICPFDEKGLPELFALAKKSGLKASTKVENADVFIIAVPTPTKERHADHSLVLAAAEMIAPHLKKNNLVVLESTVSPGITDQILIKTLETDSLKAGSDFMLAHCPERAIPGNTIYEIVNNDRIVGGIDDKSSKFTKELYSCFVKGNIYTTNARTAEFVKLMENTSRDINIALANEFALIAEDIGINVWEAIDLANKHPRVKILKPGPGVGGHCIAVDPWFIVESTGKAKIIPMAREINDSMPSHVFRNVKEIVKDIKKPKVTVFGLAYKPDVDDMRESPALTFIDLCKSIGWQVSVYDPHIPKKTAALDDAIKDSDCIVIITDHKVFNDLDWSKIASKMRNKNIFDSRNMSLKLKGWKYYLLGEK